uniref:Uncharacterized protein n=1 Tax=Arundo donax TaxID=35708 RepID=A0A0A9AFI2_ARUDO
MLSRKSKTFSKWHVVKFYIIKMIS